MSNFALFSFPSVIRRHVPTGYNTKLQTAYVPVSYGFRIRAVSHIHYRYVYIQSLAISYKVGGRLRKSLAAEYGVRPGTYSISKIDSVSYQHRQLFSQLIAYGASSAVRASVPVIMGFASKVRKAVLAAYTDVEKVRGWQDIGYSVLAGLRASTYAEYAISNFYRVRASTPVRYSANPYSMVMSIDGVPSVSIGGVVATILEGSVFIDEGEGVWRGTLTVSGMAAYLAAQLDTEVFVTLGPDTYAMLVDSRSLRMSEPAQIDTSITLISAGALISSPRAQAQDIYIDTDISASQLADRLAGSVGIDWLLPDWTLKAAVKEWIDAYPMDVLKELVDVAGGVVDAWPSGRLVARAKFPVSPVLYPVAVPDATISTTDSAISLSEEYTTLAQYGSFRLMDVPEELSDRLEFVADEDNNLYGKLYAYPQPFRTSVEVVHTSDANILIGSGSWQYREEEEVIEFVGSEANTKYPVVSVISTSWNDNTAGSIHVGYYQTKVTTVPTVGEGNGLLTIRYRTLALVYTVGSNNPDIAQFLLQEI